MTLIPRPDTTRIIAMCNQKGGVGKTTTTVNLGAAMAEFGRRVLIVDLDPQGNASTALGVKHYQGVPSVYEALDGKPLTEIMQQTPHSPNLLCVPSTIALAGAEIELVSMVARDTRLHKAIAQCYQDFDYVLIDCPPSLGLLTVNALAAAKEVLIPIQCEYYALEGLSQLRRTLDMVNEHINPYVFISTVLLTMYTRTLLANQVADEVIAHFPNQTLSTKIPRQVQVSEAPSHRMPVVTYNRYSAGAMAYVEAARELVNR